MRTPLHKRLKGLEDQYFEMRVKVLTDEEIQQMIRDIRQNLVEKHGVDPDTGRKLEQRRTG